MTGATVPHVARMYAAIFAVYGLSLPYLSVWLVERGIAPATIGIILAAPLFVRLVATPAVAILADARDAHARVIVALVAVSLGATVLLGGAVHPVAIGLLVTLMIAALQSAMPLIEVVAMREVRAGRADYGRQRMWGSVTFIVMTMIGGVAVTEAGGSVVQPMLVAATLLTLFAAVGLAGRDGVCAGGGEGAPAGRGQPASGRAAQAGSTIVARTRAQLGELWQVARVPGRIGFLVAAGLVQASHALYYAFSAVHWQSLGFSGWWIGTLWSIGVVAEILLFARARPFVARFPPERLLMIGAAAAVLRWTVTAFDPPGGVLVLMQVLHALTFGATHLAAIYFIAQVIPDEHAGAAQAFSSTIATGVAMGGTTLVAGHAYAAFGALAYLAMATIGGGVTVYCAVRLVRG